jgi:hypothetical protein
MAGALTNVIVGKAKIIPIAIIGALIIWSGYQTKILNTSGDKFMPGVEVGINYSRARSSGFLTCPFWDFVTH